MSFHTACGIVALSKRERKGQLYLRPALRPEWPPALLKSLLDSLRRQYACVTAIGPEMAPDVPSSGSLYELENDKVQDTFPAGQKRRGRMTSIAGAYPLNSPRLYHVNAHAQLLACLPACAARRGGAVSDE